MSEMQQRETDLVLNPNEYAYVLDKTKGLISCVVGSYKMSLSTSDSLVKFNESTKKFEPCSFSDAIMTFCSAPENWYVELKNPTTTLSHPTPGTSNQLPELEIGRKINIEGPASFALYPGQMARVIKGHRLNTNQYLLVKVYDVKALMDEEDDNKTKFFIKKEKANEIDEDGNIVGTHDIEIEPEVGEIFVIKGTETQFYIPPTGVEVIPCDPQRKNYVRNAITLERLEYCILRNEKGDKKYIHGPAVVFPEPDEVAITNPETSTPKFRAVELSDISGIYIKVITDYTDETTETEYKAGEELFITGKDQKIYYPRAEHSIIAYDNHIVHHAIAIPEGEGRYVMNRMTGKIRMEKGPSMFLPDPRKEVIVNRVLTRKQCELWYPGNTDVIKHNCGVKSQDATVSISGLSNSPILTDANAINSLCTLGYMNESNENLRSYTTTALSSDDINSGVITTGYGYTNGIGQGILAEGAKGDPGHKFSDCITYNQSDEEADVYVGIRRGTSYTKPRSITINNKYDGVVSIDVWTGYAVNVVSKNGNRHVVFGPQTYLMEYDESLEVLELSTGKPKTTDNLFKTVYLRVDNNKISDIINVETKDFVSVRVKVSYCVDFLRNYKDKWFNVENYVKYLTDRERSLIKREAKKYTIEEFYANATDIVRKVALNINDKKEEVAEGESTRKGMFFEENGMLVHDIEILSVHIDDEEIEEMIDKHQKEIIDGSLKLNAATAKLNSASEIAKLEKKQKDINFEKDKYIEELNHKIEIMKLDNKSAIDKKKDEEDKRSQKEKKVIQDLINAIAESQRGRKEADAKLDAQIEAEHNKLTAERDAKRTENLVALISAISPNLASAMENRSNAELLSEIVSGISPYAIAEDVPVEEFVNKLLRGTSMEEVIKKFTDKNE